jgi:hypothetical protein
MGQRAAAWMSWCTNPGFLSFGPCNTSVLGQVFESHINDFPHRDVLDVFPNPAKHCCRCALSVMSACTRGHGHQFDGFFNELEDQGAFFFPCCEIHAFDMSLPIRACKTALRFICKFVPPSFMGRMAYISDGLQNSLLEKAILICSLLLS